MFAGSHATNVAVLVGSAPANPPTFVEANGGPNTNGTGSISLGIGGVAGDILLFQNDQGFAGGETVKRASDSVSLSNFASGPSYDVSTGGGGTINSLWYTVLIAAETTVNMTGGAAATSPVSQGIFRPGSGSAFDVPVIHPSVSPGVPAWADNSATLTLDGFTPGVKTCGAVAIIVDRSGSTTMSATGFTQASAGIWTSQFGIFACTILYNFAYAGGNPVVNFNGAPGVGLPHYAYLIELKYL